VPAQPQRAVFYCQVDTVQVDACSDESHQLNNTITDHPVEEGFNVTDHSRPDPDVVTLRCFVSNTPLSAQQATRAVQEGSVRFDTTSTAGVTIGNQTGRGQEAFARLKKLRDGGTLIKVITTLRTYESSATEGMAIQSLSISRTAKNYDGLEFSVTLKQVRIVRNKKTSDKRNKDKRTGKKKKQGNQVPKAEESPDSTLFKTAEAAANSDNPTISAVGNFFMGR
jgi:hypothetical protein